MPHEDTKDQLFALRGGEGRGAQVNPRGARFERELTVLRHPAFGDVHPREHFDARADLRRDVGRDHPLLGHRAVDTEPHLHVVPFGFEVDVAGAEADGPPHQLVEDDDGVAFDGGVVREGRKEGIAHAAL